MALSNKQRAFVEAYLTHFNATLAAKYAGYQAKNDHVFASIGYENLRKPEIAEAVRVRLGESAMTADEVLRRLAEQARSDFGEVVVVVEVFADDGSRAPEDYEGQRPIRKILAFDWDKVKRLGSLVKSISFTQGGMPRVEFYDKQAALIHLGKAHGLFDGAKGTEDDPIHIAVSDARERLNSLISRLAATTDAGSDSERADE